VSDQAAPLERKGYLRSLFDFSFSSLITRRVIRTLYILITIVYSLGALVAFAGLVANHTPLGVIVAIVIVPIAYVLYLTVARVMLEVLMVIFDIGADVREIRMSRSSQPGSDRPDEQA
jgi:hypothetical protein